MQIWAAGCNPRNCGVFAQEPPLETRGLVGWPASAEQANGTPACAGKNRGANFAHRCRKLVHRRRKIAHRKNVCFRSPPTMTFPRCAGPWGHMEPKLQVCTKYQFLCTKLRFLCAKCALQPLRHPAERNSHTLQPT